MKPRGVLIAGNWKMNLGPKGAQAFLEELKAKVQPKDLGANLPLKAAFASGNLQAWVIPPAVSLETVRNVAGRLGLPLTVAAQNAHWEKSGAFTGELSGPLLLESGVSEVLIGHSERRQYFGETDETVRKRAHSLLEQGLRVMLCIGETRAEREAGKTSDVLIRQLGAALPAGESTLPFLDGRRLILAYEPVWAIGTGLTATPEQAEEAHQIIRKYLWDGFGIEAAGRTPILYGGSVTPENIDSLLGCANIDGALVGGASLKPASFYALLEAGARAVSG